MVEKFASDFFGLVTDVSTEIWICQKKIILSATKATMGGFSWFMMDFVTISGIFWRDMKKVDTDKCQMLGKVCVKVGHSAQHGAEHGAEPKNVKIFDFFKFFEYAIFSIFSPFFIKNGVFW